MMRPARALGWLIAAVSWPMFGTTFMGLPPFRGCHRGDDAPGSIQLDAALLVDFRPAPGLAAEVAVELLGRRRYGEDTGLLKPIGDGGIGHSPHHVVVNLLDHGGRRAGRRNEPDPARHLVDRQAGCDR